MAELVTIDAAPTGFAPIDLSNDTTSSSRGLIDAKHPDWSELAATWFNIAVMYEGGQLIRRHADKFLLRRPKEDSSAYQHRLELFTYENNLGTGLGWYQAEMFSSEPKIDIRPTDAQDKPIPDKPLPPEPDSFYKRFLQNCDKHGTSFIDASRDVFKNLLLYRTCHVLVDLPGSDPEKYKTLQLQKDAGALDPYTCLFTPSQVINWDKDDNGNYNWLITYQRTVKTEFLKKPVILERWYYYDRQQYRIFQCERKDDKAVDGTQQVSLVRAGYHALAKQNIVPFVTIEFPEGWWLSNRAYLPGTEHIDTVNVLRWSLRMAGLAIPVVFTDDDELGSQTLAEYQYLKFSAGSRYEWTEPEGRSWQHLANRLQVLTEEIWRALYLVAQARSTNATASAQSGVSKQQDMAPSHDVLDGMGAILRSGLQNVLKMVMMARGDEKMAPDVTGFTFEDKLTAAELDVIEEVLSLGIPSETFEKEVYKLAVRLVLKGANDDMLAEIFEQIMAGPTRDEKAAAELQQKFNMVRQNITLANKSPAQAGQTD